MDSWENVIRYLVVPLKPQNTPIPLYRIANNCEQSRWIQGEFWRSDTGGVEFNLKHNLVIGTALPDT